MAAGGVGVMEVRHGYGWGLSSLCVFLSFFLSSIYCRNRHSVDFRVGGGGDVGLLCFFVIQRRFFWKSSYRSYLILARLGVGVAT